MLFNSTMLDSIARMALSPLAPLSQPWERGELGSPPLELGEGLGVGATRGQFNIVELITGVVSEPLPSDYVLQPQLL